MDSVDPCFQHDTLLDVNIARQQMLDITQSLTEIEEVPLLEANGRILASKITSSIDVPGFANSAMDGYAVRCVDIDTLPFEMEISQRIPAGSESAPLIFGTSARIFTGAQIPVGADAVIMQEQCQGDGSQVVIKQLPQPGMNIRPQGNDLKTGETILEPGCRLLPQHIALIASVGVALIPVFRKVKVALLSTGDELVEPGKPLAGAQIYNSNRYALLTLLQQQGCEIIDMGAVEDTFNATRAALQKASKESDLIITTGGVSVGEEDHVKNALQADGELNLWKIRIKPGKPLAFGLLNKALFVGLPGNPVSALVTFLLFGIPVVRKLRGERENHFPQPQTVKIGWDWKRAKPRREYVRVKLAPTGEGEMAEALPYPKQGSDILTGMAWADGLLEIPEDKSLNRGTPLNYWPFNGLI